MWYPWHAPPSTPAPAERPRCWWHQLEQQPRLGMPFAHLFPRPPRGREPRGSEAEQLVQELKRPGFLKPTLEEIVQLRRAAPPEASPPRSPWQPVEAWQIVSIERLDERECRCWGADGAQIVEWFDRGDLATCSTSSHWSAAFAVPRRRGWRRWVARLRAWLTPPGRWELASAKP